MVERKRWKGEMMILMRLITIAQNVVVKEFVKNWKGRALLFETFGGRPTRSETVDEKTLIHVQTVVLILNSISTKTLYDAYEIKIATIFFKF